MGATGAVEYVWKYVIEGGKVERERDRETERERQRERETDRQTDSQTDRDKGRERRTDRQTDSDREKLERDGTRAIGNKIDAKRPQSHEGREIVKH